MIAGIPKRIFYVENIPSPASGEGKGEGKIRFHPHLYPLPPTEGEEGCCSV